jgi:hypothetical protein
VRLALPRRSALAETEHHKHQADGNADPTIDERCNADAVQMLHAEDEPSVDRNPGAGMRVHDNDPVGPVPNLASDASAPDDFATQQV